MQNGLNTNYFVSIPNTIQADGKEQPTAKEPLGIIQRGFVSEEEIEKTLGFVPVKETLEEKYQREWAQIGSQADLDRY